MGSDQSLPETATVEVHPVVAQLQIRNETEEDVDVTLKSPSLLDSEKKYLVKKKRIAPNTTITTRIRVRSSLNPKEVHVWAHDRRKEERIKVNRNDKLILDMETDDLIKLTLTKRH
ncbi:uncharacterized protein [Clytia hemisphaerica]|uniref:uncharacterized protein n=1 Tax=Clytia hemisphaerica TaxID=252671 RepID=UPI0034D5352A